MRSEQEMLAQIVQVARQDERIRAAYMGGSRTNPNAAKDPFQDYDVVYVVGETASFRSDPHWIDRFGERLYMQFPEDSPYCEADREHCYGWLMQFADGVRLDLHVQTPELSRKEVLEDRLCRVLLDKDGVLPDVPPESDRDHWVRRPTQEQFSCTCNEFWWCLNNVGKGKQIAAPVVFQGGVSKNAGVVQAFRDELGMDVVVDEDGHLMGAFGVALLAAEAAPRAGEPGGGEAFDFDALRTFEFVTREVECQKCANHCEIICVYRDGKIIDSWGNRCDKGAVKAG